MNFLKALFKRKSVWFILIGIAVFVYINNSSLLTKRSGQPLLLAHRGVAQTFNIKGLQNETCTAERIYKPEHS
ncbi:MAG: glycerophosphodiester phosphodiesterase, partial [Priestia megaterium]